MKKYIAYIFIAALMLPFLLGAYLDYPQDQWYVVRNAVAFGDGTPEDALAAGTSQWADYASTYYSKCYKVPTGAKSIAFNFAMTTDADTATIIVYAYKQNGGAEYVCSYSLVAGTMDDDTSTPLNYVDTLTLVSDRWYKTTWTVDAGGDNGMAKLCMNTCGARYFLVLVTAESAGALTCRASYWQ